MGEKIRIIEGKNSTWERRCARKGTWKISIKTSRLIWKTWVVV